MRFFPLLFLLGCAPTQSSNTASPPKNLVEVFTLDDDGKEGTSGAMVEVKLRVYPPNKWVQYRPDYPPPIRVRGQIPGDPEYDVFWFRSQDYPLHFYLRGPDGKDIRSFTLRFKGE